jgi:hypothetical protein
MKFLEILEKGWLAAAVIAVVMGIFNLATRMKFDNLVYMPIMCCGFCTYLYEYQGPETLRREDEKRPQKKT